MSAPAVNYLKSVEEVRKKVGPELSDDELLLKIMVPGKPGKRVESSKQASAPAAKPSASGGQATDFPREYCVEVDGEVFNVKITPSGDGTAETTGAGGSGDLKTSRRPKEAPPGAVLCGMAGLVLSFEVKVGDKVNAGDLVAMVEVMKMRRHVTCPHGGVVKEICASEGEIVQPEDLLMVVD
jgi:biotin carboxyl carrier protein